MKDIQVEGCLRCQAPQAQAIPDKENSGMNKSQLIEALAKAENIALKKAEMVVNALFENMADALVEKERIEIRGFGSFKVKFYKGYKGRNPKTGDLIKVDGRKLPFFKVGKEMRERVDH
jgi:integration host factor subunit beta